MSQSKSDTGQSMEEILASIRRIIAEGEREAQATSTQDSRLAYPDVTKEPQPPPVELGPAPRAEPEILVLTQMVQDDGSVVSLQAASSPAAARTEPAAPIAEAAVSDSSLLASLPLEMSAPTPERIEAAVETVVAAALEPFASVKVAKARISATTALTREPPKVEELGLSLTTTPLAEERTAVPAEGPKKPEIVSEEALAASTAALSQLAQSVSRSREPTPGQSKTVDEVVREAVEPMLKQWLDANLPRIVERMVREAIDRVVRRVE